MKGGQNENHIHGFPQNNSQSAKMIASEGIYTPPKNDQPHASGAKFPRFFLCRGFPGLPKADGLIFWFHSVYFVKVLEG